MLPLNGNIISFEAQKVISELSVLARPAGVVSVAQLMASNLWSDHELAKFRVLRSCTHRYDLLKQSTLFEASIWPVLDGPGLDPTALHRSHAELVPFNFLTYMSPPFVQFHIFCFSV